MLVRCLFCELETVVFCGLKKLQLLLFLTTGSFGEKEETGKEEVITVSYRHK